MASRTSKLIGVLTSALLVTLAANPAAAAAPVAQASATALRLTVAGTPTDSGSYAVRFDGTRQTSTGTNEPVLTALGGQTFLSAGTLAQNATTFLRGRNGHSAACAGLAGDGATALAVGEGSCLTPGDNLTISAGELAIDELELVAGDLLTGLPPEVAQLIQPQGVLAPLLTSLNDALDQALAALDTGVFVDLGAVQSRCTAGPGSASGTAELADVTAYARVAGRRIDLLALPVAPKPNTHLPTDLEDVAAAIQAALRTQLDTALGGALGQLGVALGPGGQLDVLTNILGTVGDGLAPLEQNVLDVVLNKQERPVPGQIRVTALTVDVLPAAQELGLDLLSLDLAESTCGPNGRVGAPAGPDDPADPPGDPLVPTRVPAGAAGGVGATDGAGGTSLLALGALAGLAVLAAAAGVAGYRRSLRP